MDAARVLEGMTFQQSQSQAAFHAVVANYERAFELLNTGIDKGYSSVMQVNIWPFSDPLRDDPRFHDLLRRMNLEP